MKSEAMMELTMIHLDEVKSTNSWMLDALASAETPLPEGTVVYTKRQTAGRGQVGNSWESETDKNISFSMLLRPVFLPIPCQFVISELCSEAILFGLEELGVKGLSVKWPNDIYVGDEKICGILIENRLSGSILAETVLGVGINVNQMKWIGNAPNPTSLRLQGIESSPEEVLDVVARHIARLYEVLKNGEAGASSIHRMFIEHLYRHRGFHPYVDVHTDEQFDAEIVDVDPQGPLMLRLQDGTVRKYWFKEVKFVLPCGVVKE